MFDFVPLFQYYELYINLCLVIVGITLFHTYVLSIDDRRNINFINVFGLVLMLFLILYIGFRPISYFFGDMGNYARHYQNYAYGSPLLTDQDLAFNTFMKVCSQFLSAHQFFALCALLYILPIYKISRQLFAEYWYYCFLLFVVSFSFWTYGVNGIRNGMATSFFLLALAYRNKTVVLLLCFLIASQIHQSLYLPILAYFLTRVVTKPKIYMAIWIGAIPLSLALGGFWETFFAGLGLADERLGGYLLTAGDAESFNRVGFRWDFLIYSAGAVFAGWYFIFKRNYYDKLYHQIFNIYVLCNAFWILVIRASFSNRFAYLSWFLMALVIIYPLLKQNFFKNQHFFIGKIAVFYFSFTYLMYYVYYAE